MVAQEGLALLNYCLGIWETRSSRTPRVQLAWGVGNAENDWGDLGV